MAGGVAAVFGIACALVKVLCGCRCHRGSVTIRPSPHHRLVRAAAPSSRTGSDCGGASERERGGGGRGGRRVAAAAAAAVRGEREATGGDGETAPIWITLSHRMLAPRNRGETTSATARLEHRTRGRGGRRRRRRRRRWRWRWRWRVERGDRGEEELTGLACRRAGR